MHYEWRTKIKARKLDPERGQVIEDVEMLDILREPNRFQMEAIIQAACRTMYELAMLEEERMATFTRLQNMKSTNGDQNEREPRGDSEPRQ